MMANSRESVYYMISINWDNGIIYTVTIYYVNICKGNEITSFKSLSSFASIILLFRYSKPDVKYGNEEKVPPQSLRSHFPRSRLHVCTEQSRKVFKKLAFSHPQFSHSTMNRSKPRTSERALRMTST